MTLSEAVSKGHDCLRDGTYLDDDVLSALLNGIASSECALAEAKQHAIRVGEVGDHFLKQALAANEERKAAERELAEAKKDSARSKVAPEYLAISDTPRTDEAVTGNSDPCADEYEDLAYFCRQLERELAEARNDSARLDWLEKGGGATDVFIDRDPPMFSIRLWPKTGPGPQYDGESLRGAIDYAREDSK